MDLIDNPRLKEILKFINQHEQDDPAQLVLKHGSNADLPIQEIASQIAARQKAKNKLPSLYKNKNLLFPPPLSMEQCSSEATAKYKAGLIKGESLIDLTGGFGIDSFYLSSSFKQTNYVEQQTQLCKIAQYNFEQLDVNIAVFNKTAEAYLENQTDSVSCIFLDPARRDQKMQRVFQWEDCQPNLIELLSQLLKKADKVMVKAAPMLDIEKACQDLNQHVSAVHIVEWQREVKELLFLIDGKTYENPLIKVVQLDDEGNIYQSFEGNRIKEQQSSIRIEQPRHYLYEPSPAVMKSGLFNSLADSFDLIKLHQNTNLFTSNTLATDFPGRIYQINHKLSPQKKALSKVLKDGKANLKTRNFPLAVEALKKRLGIKDGGNQYLFACTLSDNTKALLLCDKVDS